MAHACNPSPEEGWSSEVHYPASLAYFQASKKRSRSLPLCLSASCLSVPLSLSLSLSQTGWPQTHCVAKNDLEYLIFPVLGLQECTPPCLVM